MVSLSSGRRMPAWSTTRPESAGKVWARAGAAKASSTSTTAISRAASAATRFREEESSPPARLRPIRDQNFTGGGLSAPALALKVSIGFAEG